MAGIRTFQFVSVSVEKWNPKGSSFLAPLKNCLKGPNFVSFFEEKIQTPGLKRPLSSGGVWTLKSKDTRLWSPPLPPPKQPLVEIWKKLQNNHLIYGLVSSRQAHLPTNWEISQESHAPQPLSKWPWWYPTPHVRRGNVKGVLCWVLTVASPSKGLSTYSLFPPLTSTGHLGQTPPPPKRSLEMLLPQKSLHSRRNTDMHLREDINSINTMYCF